LAKTLNSLMYLKSRFLWRTWHRVDFLVLSLLII